MRANPDKAYYQALFARCGKVMLRRMPQSMWALLLQTLVSCFGECSQASAAAQVADWPTSALPVDMAAAKFGGCERRADHFASFLKWIWM